MGGFAAIAFATTLFSWGFIIVKGVGLPSPITAMWRLTIASVFLLGVALVLRLPWPRRWSAVVGAGICFGLHQLAFITATQLTSVAIVTLLMALQPLTVSLVSRRTVGERVPPILVLWGGVALVGVAFVMVTNAADASHSWLGDLLGVANLGVFTAYFLLAKRARLEGAPTVTLTISATTLALVVVLPVVPFVGGVVPQQAYQWWLLVALALGPGSGHLLVNWAHPRVSAALASLLLASIPLLSSIWAHLVFHEPYTWRHFVGMVLVTVAIEGGRRAEARGRERSSES